MARALLLALLLAPALGAASLPEFGLARAMPWRPALFAQARDTQGFPHPGNPRGEPFPERPAMPGPGRNPEASPAPEPQSARAEEVPEDRREIQGWFGRGFGISVYGGLYPILLGAGAGLELAMPVHEQVSLVARASLAASLQFEGQIYDFGARVYFDRRRNFSWYTDLTFRVAYGRVLDTWGSTLDEPVRAWGLGGNASAGFEIGSRRVRFFLELTINAVDFSDVRDDLLLHWGSNFGLRLYIG